MLQHQGKASGESDDGGDAEEKFDRIKFDYNIVDYNKLKYNMFDIYLV